MRLAELVLHATSVEHETGGVAVNGFLLHMPKLFEDFVTVALREALVPAYGGRVDDQDRNHLDEARRVRLRPDLVWKLRGSPAAVIDAKYPEARKATIAYIGLKLGSEGAALSGDQTSRVSWQLRGCPEKA